MKRFYTIFNVFTGIFLFGLAISVQAQQTEYCHTTQQYKELLKRFPDRVDEIQQNQAKLEKFTQQYIQSHQSAKAGATPNYIIPVVFHVLHDNGPENISDAQIHDAIRIMNEDFNAQNSDTSDLVADFKSILGDANVQFRLAQIDDNGNPTDGIERYETTETYDASIYDQTGRIWPRDMYMNIFTAADIGGAAGYTFLPGTQWADYDGIMILHDYVGSIGTSSPNNSRSLTHEIGHWLNLKHPWGDSNDPGVSSNCSYDDGVSDTPNTIGWQSCDLSGTSCSSLDNVQNFMDYSYCSVNFTEGQVARVRAALESSTADRNNLWTESNLQATGLNQLFAADFSANKKVVCVGNSVYFQDNSLLYNLNQWNWNFGSISSTEKNPEVQFTNAGIYDVSLNISNDSSSLSTTKSSYILVGSEMGAGVPFEEGFEDVDVPNAKWNINNIGNDGYQWKRVGSIAASGNYSMQMENYGNTDGSTDELYSTTLDLSPFESASLSFKYAYAQKDGSEQDIFKVLISNDCGDTWTTLLFTGGGSMATASATTSSFVPSSSDWVQKDLSIPSFTLTEGALLKFEFKSAGGNNFYIDDINIDGTHNLKPLLASPYDGQTNVGDLMKIDWKAVDSTSSGNVTTYEYEVDVVSSFDSGEKMSGTKSFMTDDPNGSDSEQELSGLTHGETYFWRVRAITDQGTTSDWSDTWSFTVASDGVGTGGLNEENPEGQPHEFSLNVYPNPVNDRSTIRLSLKTSANVSMNIYNILGEKVKTVLNNKPLSGGEYQYPIEQAVFDPGIYFVKLSTDNGKTKITKIIIK